MNIIRLHADAYKSQDDGTDSKNKWSTDLNYDYQFDPTVSFNYLIGYKKDHFSGFDYQLYTGPGMGMKVLNSDAHKLDFQANMLYSQDKPENEPLDTYVSTKFGGIYQWKIQDNVKFIQEATYRVDLEKMNNYFVYAKTAFETKINSSLSMGVSYKIDYVNMPPPPAGNNDRTFLVSLIIDY
jgi:putative salt-induced outer membrane protein